MTQIKTAKSAWTSKFNSSCAACSMKHLCVSASSLSKDLRYHFLYIKGQRFPENEAMRAGTERHRKAQKDIPRLEDYGLYNFQKDLREGKHIQLAELRVCNSVLGIRGIIDIFDGEMKDGVLNMHATELKSGWFKGYIMQAGSYAMMLNHPATRICIEETKRSGKKVVNSYRMWPQSQFSQNIGFSIKLFNAKKPFEVEYMKDNMMTDWAKGLKMAIDARLKKFRSVNQYGLFYLSEIPVCKHCSESCGYYPVCSKSWPTNGKIERQLHFGNKQLLIKTKPQIPKRPK
jgi:hypothetical protein